ncbi:MAG: hypothetical protein PHY43_10530 [Verrucomicrobiales bacterium]|nr:hypothetical protein [Verrucomicrobiales bacterium]
MHPEEFEDAKLLWKMFYAGQSFQHARAAAEHILKENISADDAILYPLMTAVYVLYGRPFKKSHGVGCFGEELIPLQYRELHGDLLKHRDKILAHSDSNSFEWLNVGQANQVRLIRRSKDKSLICSQLQATPALLPHIVSLCLELQEQIESKKRELFRRYEKYVPVQVGEYILNIEDSSGDFFRPVKPIVETK